MEGHSHDCRLLLEPKTNLPQWITWQKITETQISKFLIVNHDLTTQNCFVSFVSEHHPVLIWKSVDVHRFSRKQIFGGAKDFCPNFPKLFRKVLWDFPYKISLQRSKIMKAFLWYDLQKKLFMCFSGNVGRQFFKSNNVGRHFCPNFQRFCSDFRQIKTFGGALAPPPPLPLDAL